MLQTIQTFKGLLAKYEQGLIAFATSYTKDFTIAEELVSDVFYALWERRDKLQQIDNVESYLYIAVKNKCLNHLKSKTGQKNLVTEHPESLDFLVERLNPESELLTKELQAVLDSTVEQLPHSCKAVFKLVKECGMSHVQAAQVLEISPKTVENQIAKAVKRIRMAVSDYKSGKSNFKISYQNTAIIVALIFFSIFFNLP